ncbi:MAG: hypothetical protein ACO1N5_05055 [Noviherbaspirillum sp.]
MSPQSEDLIAFLHALEDLFERYQEGWHDAMELRRIEAQCASAVRRRRPGGAAPPEPEDPGGEDPDQTPR